MLDEPDDRELDELDDSKIDAIWENAREAAVHAWRGNWPTNPYPDGTDKADIWAHAFRNSYANHNH